MVLAGREIGGAIVIGASVISFVYMQMAISEASRKSAMNLMREVDLWVKYFARRAIYRKENDVARAEQYHLEMADIDQQRQVNRYAE